MEPERPTWLNPDQASEFKQTNKEYRNIIQNNFHKFAILSESMCYPSI